MANAIPWHGNNKTLSAPNHENIGSLPVFNNDRVTVSCWQLTEAEIIDIIQNGGKIFVAVMYGKSQPPMFVGTEDSVRSVVIDYGKVWKKEKV